MQHGIEWTRRTELFRVIRHLRQLGIKRPETARLLFRHIKRTPIQKERTLIRRKVNRSLWDVYREKWSQVQLPGVSILLYLDISILVHRMRKRHTTKTSHIASTFQET